jgi:protein involved in polysaccharide export with SLBB domain
MRDTAQIPPSKTSPHKTSPKNALFGLIVALLGALVLAACSASAPMNAIDPAPAQTQYKLGAGDKLIINVFGDKNLSGERQVDGAGAFTFPLIGNVQAGGLSSGELETLLESKLKEYMREPNVSVEIVSYRPFYIVGEVRRPGSYPYVDGMTVMNAIAIAGGFTYRAQEKEFVIQRNNSSAGAGQITRIAPGDVIVVRERFF